MTAELVDEDPGTPPSPTRQHPRPLDTITAASQRLTTRNFNRFAKHNKDDDPQAAEARQMFRTVGELRFLATTLANRVGQARFYVGRLSDDPLAEPEPLPERVDPDEERDEEEDVEEPTSEDLAALDAWGSFAQSPVHVAQLVGRCAVNLFTTGDGWFVGVPPDIEKQLNPPPVAPVELITGPAPKPKPETAPEQLDLTTLTWRYLSTVEVKFNTAGSEVTITIADTEKGSWTGSPDHLLMFRCWRPDPFEWWLADSPTRANLGVLRELVSASQAIDSQLDSRLAGAGILLVPQEAKDAVLAAAGPAPSDAAEDYDPFVDAIMEAMLTPISDRQSASAVVPLILTVPGETIEKFKHLQFASPLDELYPEVQEKALRRLALGSDAPPELLLGVGGMNHWGAWLVGEDTVTTHVEPPCAIVCDSWTTQYLWPVLIDNGMDPDVAHRYVIWYSVEHLIVRPNRYADAKDAHAVNALSDDALRRYGGFDKDDAPEGVEADPVLRMMMVMVQAAPSLAQNPGIPALVEQLRAALAGKAPAPANAAQAEVAGSPDGVPETGAENQGPPDTSEAPAEIAASGSLDPGWPFTRPEVHHVGEEVPAL